MRPARPPSPSLPLPTRSLALLLAVLTLGCSGGEGAAQRPDEDSTPADVPPDEDLPWRPPEATHCVAFTPWDGQQPLFRDASEDWGLPAIGAEGVRATVIDIDGDGWPDLILRRGGTRVQALDGQEPRSLWVLRNEGGERFTDITASVGLTDFRWPDPSQGHPVDVVAVADIDNDGWLDLYNGLQTADSALTGGATSEVLRNQEGTGFAFFPNTAADPLRALGGVDSPAGASFVDVNLDGNIDLWIAQHGYSAGGGFRFQGDVLLLGAGDGTFRDLSADAGLTTLDWVDADDVDAARGHSRAWSSLACDLDNDGWPELLAASYGRAPNHLWHARPEDEGEVRYVNVSVQSGYAYDDNQTWQDNQFARCHCQANRNAEGCEGVPAPSIQCQANWNHNLDRRPFRLGGNSGTTLCADLNNNGWMDLVTTEIRHWWAGEGSDASAILYNTGESPPRFERPSRAETGLEVPHVTQGGWDEGHITAAALDVDNDGRLDLYIGATDYPGNRGLLYIQGEDGTFRLAPASAGPDHNRSHGVAVADFNRDGALDLLVGHSRARCSAGAPNDCYATPAFRLFQNVHGQRANWVQLRLEGAPGTNRAAIGARVTLTTPDGMIQSREVGGGHGHYGMQDDLVLHFGLGGHCEAEIHIRWPNRAHGTQSFRVTSGHLFHVREGDNPEPVVLPGRTSRTP